MTFATIAAISLAIMPALGAGKVLAFSGSGSGTSGDPYQITDCEQLDSIKGDLTADYALANDIDCSNAGTLNGGSGWSPIGSSGGFQGILDGQGHKIKNLDLSGMSDSTSFSGMFNGLSGSGLVENLSIINSKINGAHDIGMIAGSLSDASSLDNIYVNATVTCHAENCGGLVGSMRGNGLIIDSGADVTVTGATQTVGGLVGWIASNGTIMESYADGNVSGVRYVGGLVGAVNNSGSPAIITNTYSSATVVASDDTAGGLVGLASTLDLTNSYAAGSVAGTDNVGGLVGLFDGFMAQTFAAEQIHGTGSADGPVTGDFAAGSVGNRYYDSTISGFSSSPDGSLPIANSNAFKDNSTNHPFDQWDFTSIWRTNYANYPSFAPKFNPEMLCAEPRSTNTTITGHCIVEPLGWGTPSWQARWSVHRANVWHTVHLGNIHEAQATVTGLTPGTTYDLQFRFTNNFGTSTWGTVEILTTGTAPKPSATNSSSANVSSLDQLLNSPTALATTTSTTPAKTSANNTSSSPSNSSPTASSTPTVKFKDTSAGHSHRVYYWAAAAVIVIFGLLILFHPKRPKEL